MTNPQATRRCFELLEDRRLLDAGRFAGVTNPLSAGQVDGYDQVVAGDFNADGRGDLFFIVHATGSNRFAFGLANRQFNVVTNRLSTGQVDGYSQVVVGDFNRDGRSDLFFLNFGSGSNRLALAGSGETFSIITNPIAPGFLDDYTNVVAGDFDRDGDDDLFLLERTTGSNRLARAGSNNTFSIVTNPISNAAVDGYTNIVTGDFDGDDRADLFFLHRNTGSNRYALARSNNTFRLLSNPLSAAAVNGYSFVTALDFDNDGRDDLFLVNRTTGNNRVVKSLASEQFELRTNGFIPELAAGFTQLTAADFDNDDRGDLYLVNKTSGANRLGLSRRSFDIDLQFGSGFTSEQRGIIQDAADRWSEVILGDLPDVDDQEFGLIDDLLLEIQAVAIDGANNTLGTGFVRDVRNSELPFLGRIQFDTADLGTLSALDLFTVAAHEMGHTLGMEEITWTNLGLLTGIGGPFPQFTGTNARRELEAVFGDSAGDNVPIENTGAAGSQGDHWRESVLQKELMTSQISTGEVNPLSRITIGALDDMGYTVDYAAADAYTPLV